MSSIPFKTAKVSILSWNIPLWNKVSWYARPSWNYRQLRWSVIWAKFKSLGNGIRAKGMVLVSRSRAEPLWHLTPISLFWLKGVKMGWCASSLGCTKQCHNPQRTLNHYKTSLSCRVYVLSCWVCWVKLLESILEQNFHLVKEDEKPLSWERHLTPRRGRKLTRSLPSTRERENLKPPGLIVCLMWKGHGDALLRSFPQRSSLPGIR